MNQISLTDQEAFLSVTEVPGHLTHPQPLRLPGDSPDLHPSTRQVDEEEHQEPRQTLAGPGLEGEKVRRHDHITMPGEKLLPGGFPLTLRSRFQPVLLQNAGNRAARHLMAQISERSLDSPVAPIAVLSGHADHQLLDLVCRAWTARAALLATIVLPGDQPAMPGQERCGCHNRGQIIKHTPAQFLGPDGQASPLVVAKPHSLTSELLPQHAILFLKVVDDVLLLVV